MTDVAISPIVYYSPDRHYRITADLGGRRYRIERDLVLVTEMSSLAELIVWLQRNGLDIGDLVED